VVEGADAHPAVERAGKKGIGGAEAGAQDAKLLVALLLEPVNTAADVDDRLPAGGDGAPYIGADRVVGAFQLGWFPDYPDAEDYITPFYGTKSNFTSNGYSNAKMDAIIKNEEGAKTLAQRLTYIKQAQVIAAQDAPPSYGPVFADTASVSPATLDLQPGASGTVNLTAASLTGSAQTVNWTASAPSGVSVSPASGALSVAASGKGSAALTVTAGAADGAYTVTVDLTSSAGAIIPVQLAVIVAKPGDLAPYYNVTGISDDGSGSTADYDGDGFSYSEQALAAAGLSPGGSVISGGLTYTWPSAAAGQPDAIMAGGQTIPVAAAAGATSLGFLGSAVNAGTAGASGTLTITYTDGTTSTATLGMSDWTLAANSGTPQFGDVTVATTPYRNAPGGSQSINTYIFAQTIPIDGTKTVASITLPPAVSNGSIGIFAVSAG